MSKIISLRKGLDINLAGAAAQQVTELPLAAEYGISPLDFEGVTPKLLVKVGDEVKAGTRAVPTPEELPDLLPKLEDFAVVVEE